MTATALPPILAGRYELLGFLGKGQYGEVWHARDHNRGHEVALKLMRHKNKGVTWREATLLTVLKSHYILEVNNADVAGDVPYIDTQLAEGSLDHEAEPNGVEPNQAIDWTRHALLGLKYCHQMRLLHRDVKPANLFLRRGGGACLGDFGVAGLMDTNGETDDHGDPLIRAPEMYSSKTATVRSDVYSTAATLYGLLVGRLPFESYTDVAELTGRIMAADYTDIRDAAPHVSQALAERVRTGLAVDPQDRYGSAAEFHSALGELKSRKRKFHPVDPHPGEERRWLARGKGQDIEVRVAPGSTGLRRQVLTCHVRSGNRIKVGCFETTVGQLPQRLRVVFDKLRA